MPLINHATFGQLYLDPNEFMASRELFGVGSAIPQDYDMLKAFLAAASRWVDAKTCKTFVPSADHVEQHTLNPLTGRLSVNNPPVMSISDFRIFTGANTSSPVALDSLFINNQERWVELLMQPFVFPQLAEVIVQITYKSIFDVPSHIKLATGYVAAAIMSDASTSSKFPSGVKSIKIGSQASITREDPGKGADAEKSNVLDFHVPSMVNLLLANEIAIGIA